MMLRISLILLSFVCLFTKQVNATSANIDTLNGGYYSLINKAELAIIDSSYSTADSLFNIAFSVSKRSFGQDFFQAAVNATRLNFNDLVLDYLEKSISNGVRFSQIKKDKELKKYFESKEINITKKATFPHKRLRQEYVNQLNKKTRRRISRLVFKDQLVRTIPGFFELFSYHRDRKSFKNIYEICITTGKIPGYSEIGENIKSKDELNDLPLLLRHFNLYEIRVLEPYILKGIDEGDIYPWDFATAVDYGAFKSMSVLERTKDSVTFSFQFIYGALAPYFLGDNYVIGNTEDVNNLRNSIGLEPIQDQIYKTGKTLKDYSKYPATNIKTYHRKSLSKIWKKGKLWKK